MALRGPISTAARQSGPFPSEAVATNSACCMHTFLQRKTETSKTSESEARLSDPAEHNRQHDPELRCMSLPPAALPLAAKPDIACHTGVCRPDRLRRFDFNSFARPPLFSPRYMLSLHPTLDQPPDFRLQSRKCLNGPV